jgi:hypothetical protein
MEKYGFVYIWYDRKHKRFYIGSHWGYLDDGYICSSPWMKRAFKTRPQDFKRRILKTVHTGRNDLLKEEHRWLQMIRPEELKHRYYNLNNKAWNLWFITPEGIKTVGQKISKSLTGYKHDEATRQRFSDAQRKAWTEGKRSRVMTDEQKKRISATLKGRPLSEETRAKMKGRVSPTKGRKLSEETKRKISEAKRMSYLHSHNLQDN